MIKDSIISPERALERVQALCARQERCTYDISLKLRQWRLSSVDIEKIVRQLITDRFLSDERYAKMFVREKSKFNKWGSVKITYALKSKGFSEDIIKNALDEIDHSNDESILMELLSRKMKGTKAKSLYDLKSKIIRFGISRGFDYEIVNRIASLIIKET